MEGFPMNAPAKVLVVDVGGTNVNAFLGGFRLWGDAKE